MGDLTVENSPIAAGKIGLTDDDLAITSTMSPGQATCRRCGACCTHQVSIRMSLYDIARLAASMNLPFKNFVRQHCKIVSAYDLTGHGPVPGLALTTKRGVCPFFKAGKGCIQYESRPDVCRLFPLNNLYITRSAQLKMMRSQDKEYSDCCVMGFPNNVVFNLDFDSLASHAIRLDVTAGYLAEAMGRWGEEPVRKAIGKGESLVNTAECRNEYVRGLGLAFKEFDAHNKRLLTGILENVATQSVNDDRQIIDNKTDV